MIEILASLNPNNGGDGKNNNKKKQAAACPHPAFVNKNLCAVCNKSVNKSSIPTTLIPFGYLFRDLSLTVDAIQRLRDLDLHQLLQRKRLHLVLDLDNTLIHAIDSNKINVKKKKNNKNSSSSCDGVYEILKGATSVKLRPGARDFLKKATELFDLSIYTTARESYAKEIARILGSQDSVHFSSIISREYSAQMGKKSLDMVLSHQRVTLIVDDLEDVWATQDRGNLIKIQPYTFFQNGVDSPPDYDDQDLERVWTILKNLHSNFFDKKNQNNSSSKDVRQLLRINNNY